MWTSSSSFSSSAPPKSLSSSSTSTSSPSFYTTINCTINTNPRLPKTMEEVWKDISLVSDLQRRHHHHPSSRGMILQDFFSKDPPPNSVSSSGFSASPPPPPPLPPTMLTLNSAPDHFSSLLLQPHNDQIQPISHASSMINVGFDEVVPDDNAGGGKKRFPDFDRSSGDRRHKRMIKNRESAARSRARKQEIIFLTSSQLLYFFILA